MLNIYCSQYIINLIKEKDKEICEKIWNQNKILK
jgi:hypothetical protein